LSTPRSRLGQWGERYARRHLEGKSYTVAAANYRCRWGEVDLVTRFGEEVVFVEVKTRRGADFGTPEESITPGKARRLVATAQHYLEQEGVEQSEWRIDLVSVHLDKSGKLERISHIEYAVEL
jgi:putative endonuclease